MSTRWTSPNVRSLSVLVGVDLYTKASSLLEQALKDVYSELGKRDFTCDAT